MHREKESGLTFAASCDAKSSAHRARQSFPMRILVTTGAACGRFLLVISSALPSR